MKGAKCWEGEQLALSRQQHFIPLKKPESQWPNVIIATISAMGACGPDIISCPFLHLKCFIVNFFKESIPHN